MSDLHSAIQGVVNSKTLALVGVSRSTKKFGYQAYQELTGRGYTVYPINPAAGGKIGDVTVYTGLNDLPARPDAVVIMTPPQATEAVVKECSEAGLNRVWVQPGAESAAALKWAADHNMDVVNGQCILMHAQPVRGFHSWHRAVVKLFGRLP